MNEDKALLWQGVITGKYDITINETLLGEDITYIGYPTTAESGNMSYGMDGMVIDIDPPTEEQKQMLWDIVYSAAATSEYDAEIYSIIEEEAQSFLDGPKSAEEVAGIIQSRVQLYIDEIDNQF